MTRAGSAPSADAPLPGSDGLDEPTRARWLWDHAGRIAGVGLVLLAFAAMVFLAAIGFKPALFLVVLLVAGFVMIALGGRIRGSLR